MTIPSVVDDTAGSTGTAGAFSVPLPTGSSYIAVTSAKRSTTGEPVVPPSGWTLVPGTDQWEDDARVWNRGGTYHANADDSPGTSWTLASGGDGAQVVIIGLDEPTTVDASGSNTSDTSPAVTATEAVLVVRSFSTNAFDATPPVASYPSGSTSGVQAFFATSSADDGNLAALAWADQGAGGSTGTAAWSMSAGSTFESVAATAALIGSATTATGTITATTADATASAAGTVDNPGVEGAVSAITEDATAALAGTVVAPSFSGTITATTEDAVASLSGTVTGAATGAISATTEDATAALAGTVSNPAEVDITFTVGTTRVGSFSVDTTRVGSFAVGETVTQRGP